MSIIAIIKNPSIIIENSNYRALSLIILVLYSLGYFFFPTLLYSVLEWSIESEWMTLWKILVWLYFIGLVVISYFSINKVYSFCDEQLNIKNHSDDNIIKKCRLARKFCKIFITIFLSYYVIWISYFVACDIFNQCFIEDSGATLAYSIIYFVFAIIFPLTVLGLFKLIFSNNKIPEHLKRKGTVIFLGFSGSATALFSPIILAYVQQGRVDFDITKDMALFYLVASFVIGLILLISKKIRADKDNFPLTAFMLGAAMPSLCLNFLGGIQIHELQPKDSNIVNIEKVQGGRILQLKTSSTYQVPSKNLKVPFIRSAYAEEHTADDGEVPLDSDSSNDLNSNLNKPFNVAARFTNFLTSDIVNNLGKKYIISIAEFNSEDEAFTYYTKCIQESYNITNSYVLELIPDSNYRVIFPSLDDKLSRGEANYKLYLLSENMKKEGDCLKTELSILEFE